MIYKNLRKYLNSYISTRLVFVLDLIMSFGASLLTLYLVNNITVRNLFELKPLGIWLASSFLFSFIFIWAFRTYRIIIRHMTIKELSRFLLVAVSKVLMMGFVFALLDSTSKVLNLMMISDFFFTFAAFFLLRVAMLLAYDLVKVRMTQRYRFQNVLIYGVGDRSVSLISRLQNSENYRIVGFVQHGNHDVNHVISEVKVYYVSSEEQFANVVLETEAVALLFADEEDARHEKDRLIRYAMDCKIKTLLVPPIDEIKEGKIAYAVRKVEIEDLLMRQEIEISMNEIIANFEGKTIMVTGAAGSIGSELCRQLAGFGVRKLILFDNAETPMHNLRLELEEKFPELDFVPVIGDVRLLARLDYVFRTWHPQIVFHAAAYKHVPLMEDNPCEAVMVNVTGSRNVADKCIEYDVEKMVMVSTDKAVNPTNIMGCTKRLAEIYVQSLGLAIEQGRVKARTKFVTTRFGNVLGSNGSVIPRFREQIAKGGPVTVTHPDITRFFMTIPEACRLVMEAATMSSGNEIFVFDMGESVKIDELARRMIRLAGYTPDKDIMVEYTGLRPGEKLYEEVLSNQENTVPTDHSRIRIAKVREYGYESSLEVLENLEKLAQEFDVPALVTLMKITVPEFVSKNSPFEEFDRK
ncbi:MAG: polysaccharide biosynthesis protein [Bacteroidales bacterium]|nr:polysaccharide biosynthesis protein [Bacteroidales bacterium]